MSSNSNNNSPEQKDKSVIIKILIGLKDYLTNWKNLLGHALLGVGLLVLAIWAPVKPWIKIIFFVALVTFNVWRMSRKKNAEKANTDSGADTAAEPIAEVE